MKPNYRDGRRKQLGLFHPRLQLPGWWALPKDLHEQVKPLLAQILTAAMKTTTTHGDPEEEVKG